jgi:tetratricopeptide (TPR) repeat protein
VAETEGEAGLSLWSYRQLYWYLMRHSHFAEAESLAAVRESTGDDADPTSRALLLYDQGVALLRQNRPNDAVSLLAEAAAIRRSSVSYMNTHALALAATGRHVEAAETWAQALTLPRRSQSERRLEIPMRLARGHSLATSGKRLEGLREARWVLMVQPDNRAARTLAEELAYE